MNYFVDLFTKGNTANLIINSIIIASASIPDSEEITKKLFHISRNLDGFLYTYYDDDRAYLNSLFNITDIINQVSNSFTQNEIQKLEQVIDFKEIINSLGNIKKEIEITFGLFNGEIDHSRNKELYKEFKDKIKKENISKEKEIKQQKEYIKNY